MCVSPILLSVGKDYDIDFETGEYKRNVKYLGYALSYKDAARIFVSPDSFVLKPEFQDKFIVAPCGVCDACFAMRAREWAARCVFEAQTHFVNSFVTLTYDDSHLPADYGLHKRDLQLFWKRLRKNTGLRVRYFACGEYGELYSRPHYHAIIFGYKPNDLILHSVRSGNNLYVSPELSSIWQQGFVSIGDVTFESCSYVAGYIMKKQFKRENYQGREPPFVCMSRRPGIAYEWYQRYKNDVFPNDFVVVRDGIKLRPPRFFEKVYEREFLPSDVLLDDIKDKRLEKYHFQQVVHPDEYTFTRLDAKAKFLQEKKRKKVRDYEV